MKLHELKAPPGARQKAKRVGRGTGSGHGKTSTRGQKGQNARSEGFRLGFEGGQMPLAQRLPKLGGFKNPFKVDYAIVNLSKLSRFEDGTSLDQAAFVEAGLADEGQKVKILGAGKLRRKLTVTADAVSESARAAIEARGGTITVGEKRDRTRRKGGKKDKKGAQPARPAVAAAEPEETKEPEEAAQAEE